MLPKPLEGINDIDCIVSFSGGIESTALLQYLKDNNIKPIALYSYYPLKNHVLNQEFYQPYQDFFFV